jgi:uncharacterized coiled-coil protein SlyX
MEGTLLEWVLGSGIGIMIVKDIFLRKYQNNQDRIDNAIVESVKALEKGHGEHELKIQALEFSINNQALVLEDLKSAWKENNNALKEFNQTVRILSSELKEQHGEMKMLVKDNTKIMERVSQFIEKKTNG